MSKEIKATNEGKTSREWSRRRFTRGVTAGAAALLAPHTMPSLMAPAMAHLQSAGRLHHKPTAKSVILLFMSGGPSHVDTFDPKPELTRLAGKDVPDSIAANVPKIRRAGLQNLMASPWKFRRHGASGLWVSSLFPETAKLVDGLCIVRSMQHRNPVHGPAECVALTGTSTADRPSIGAWSVYGLGALNENLPAFMALNLHTDGMQYPQACGWGAGFLPAEHQATLVDPTNGIRFTKPRLPESRQRKHLQLIDWFNRQHQEEHGRLSELQARRRSYELAFRMQTAAPSLLDLSGESQRTFDLYGGNRKESADVARALLTARRMVERGVRFVQVRVGGWDAHGNLRGNHEKMAGRTDAPVAGLIRDLRQRGLFDETLVVWGGEFGRTPTMEGRGNGRDHSPAGYTMWLAGGGVRGGQAIGATDPLGYVAVEQPVTPHDMHATILHACGLDADRVHFDHHGRQELPTVNGGQVIRGVFES